MGIHIKSADEAARKARLTPASFAISGGSKQEKTRAMQDSGMSSSSVSPESDEALAPIFSGGRRNKC